MGISNQIPSSRLIQPGVIASAAERPASPFEGQCIFQKDTDQLLVWNGTAWVIPNSPAQNPDGLELITMVSPTPATIIAVTGCFSSVYSNYKVIITPISSASSSDIRIKLRAGTTPASISYYMANTFAGGTSISAVYEGNQISWRGVYCGTGGVSTYNYLTFDIFGPFNTAATRYQMNSSAWDGAQINNRSASGFHDQAVSYDSFELSGAANITATIAVYGYRN